MKKLILFSILLAFLIALLFTSCDTFALGGSDVTTQTFTVSFNVNGGSGTAPAAQTVNAGSSILLPSGSGLTRSGFTFNGWNTNTAGTGTNYPAGSSFAPTANITLYARWISSGPANFGTVIFVNETHIPVNVTSTSLRPNSFTLRPHSRREVEVIHRFPITFSFTWTDTGHRASRQINGPNHTHIFGY
jgi:uncharacterized repeat protein (TIGR02543 family)